MPIPLLAGAPPPPAIILITDPLAGYSYILDTAQKIARRSVMPRGGAVGPPMNFPLAQDTPPAPPRSVPGKSQPQFKTEDLGTQFMEGLSVHGRRTTVTYRVGSIGNDREIANVAEIWSNTELGLMILRDRSDPRTGETVTKLENVSRAQPDPRLFQPPPDYKIVDVTTAQ